MIEDSLYRPLFAQNIDPYRYPKHVRRSIDQSREYILISVDSIKTESSEYFLQIRLTQSHVSSSLTQLTRLHLDFYTAVLF